MSWGYHNSVTALIDSDAIFFADYEERYSRQKFDSSFPKLAPKEMAEKYDSVGRNIAFVKLMSWARLPRVLR